MIPQQLREYPLIRVCRPSCRSHKGCDNPGKRPVSSTKSDESESEVEDWIHSGGNYGVVARSDNDLVIFDSDSEELTNVLTSSLPITFTIESGGEGFGQHHYFKCRDFNVNTGWKDPEGSVRSDNWQAVGPSSTHPETGNQYKVIENVEIARVKASDLYSVKSKFDDLDDVQSGGGSAGRPSAHPISDSLGFIRRNDRRREINEILKTNSAHSRRVWMTGWLHAAAGLTENEIVSLIMSEASWNNLDREIVKEQVTSVINSSRSDRGTHYTKFGTSDPRTADMDGKPSERRKTDTEDRESSVNEEVNTDMVDYNDHEEVTILEGSEDGDSFKKVVRTTREEDGDTVEYVSIKSGRVELVETVDGDEVLARRVNDSTSLGSPEYIGELAEALQELDSKINGKN
jgi:hypothetical protein